MKTKTINQKLQDLVVLSGLDNKYSKLQVAGKNAAFLFLLKLFEIQRLEDHEVLTINLELTSEPLHIFGKTFLQGKNIKNFSHLTIVISSKDCEKWELSEQASQVILEFGVNHLQDFVDSIRRRATKGGDFMIGPEFKKTNLTNGESIREWRKRNLIFVF